MASLIECRRRIELPFADLHRCLDDQLAARPAALHKLLEQIVQFVCLPAARTAPLRLPPPSRRPARDAAWSCAPRRRSAARGRGTTAVAPGGFPSACRRRVPAFGCARGFRRPIRRAHAASPASARAGGLPPSTGCPARTSSGTCTSNPASAGSGRPCSGHERRSSSPSPAASRS